MEVKSPQEWYIQSLSSILVNKDEYLGDFKKDEAYKYVIKSFTDKYSNTFISPEVNGEKSTLFNMYWESFKPEQIDTILESVIVSKKASDYLKTHSKGEKLNQKLHLEHLTPMSYTRDKLLMLENYDCRNVKKCFKYAMVSLITKEESKRLDSGAVLTNKDIEVLKYLQEKYDKEIEKSEIIEAEELLVHKSKLKQNGNGLLRIIHLYNCGVKFVNNNGNELEIDDLYIMLRDNRFFLHQYKY